MMSLEVLLFPSVNGCMCTSLWWACAARSIGCVFSLLSQLISSDICRFIFTGSGGVKTAPGMRTRTLR